LIYSLAQLLTTMGSHPDDLSEDLFSWQNLPTY